MRTFSLISVGALACAALGLASPRPATVVPDTVVLDGQRLVNAKAQLKAGNATLKAALKHLTAQADSWLTQGPWTVTSKSTAPPNGTLNDYSSQAPFYWPNPDSPDGCPWTEKDGIYNPEAGKLQDRTLANKMFNSTYALSLAWYYTGNASYSQHAADIVRTWFLNPETAMNPALDFAQSVPCSATGRSYGIIDFSQEYTTVLDAVAILSTNAPGWTTADAAGFKAWNTKFLTWLTESAYGKTEAKNAAEHGTYANFQITALALFTGNKNLAVSITNAFARKLIDGQFVSNGTQPLEVGHTRSFHYANLNLGAHLRWALLAKKIGIDLYSYKGPQGQSLFKAARFLIPAAEGGQSAWPYKELAFAPYAATDNLDAAADAGDCQAQSVVNKLPPPPGGNIFALRPAPQQLDSIIKYY
ncbi:hypothetical protein PT974_01814 [Cladobotryum mycophilum]|uniref:Alginate lyase domain-containing protein n=1 Tax=Cladobotryum mycophilum TaxID=491253 RepID=A0ABR0SWH7_9HYPO